MTIVSTIIFLFVLALLLVAIFRWMTSTNKRQRRFHGLTHLHWNIVLGIVGLNIIWLAFFPWLYPKVISPLQDGRQTDYRYEPRVLAKEPEAIISPLQDFSTIAILTPTPVVNVHGEIAEYIRQVFGKDAQKAFLLLSCENAKLNPDAVNTAGNYPAGSRDIGVFQINEHWQAVQGKFLFNWKINVEIAHQLYTENGNFQLWSCGKKLGI